MRTALAPDWWDANAVRVEDGAERLDAATLLASAERLQDGLRHRRVEVEDERAGERLRAPFAAAGWLTERHAFMRREGDAIAAAAPVREVPFARTRALRLEWYRAADWWSEREAPLLDSQQALAERNGTRAFMAGEQGFACLWTPPGRTAGEIEQVYVTPAWRGRGLGSALVRAALAAGARRVNWIVADDEDRPKRLYERLGFRTAWVLHLFTRLPSD